MIRGMTTSEDARRRERKVIRRAVKASRESLVRDEAAIVSTRVDGNRDLDEARWRGHEHEHALSVVAVSKAEAGLDRRLEGMNQFRAQLDRQAADFITREAYDAQTDRFDAIFRAQAAKHDSDNDALKDQVQTEREIRKSFEASVNTWKWIASFLGASGIGGVILLFVTRAHP